MKKFLLALCVLALGGGGSLFGGCGGNCGMTGGGSGGGDYDGGSGGGSSFIMQHGDPHHPGEEESGAGCGCNGGCH